MGGAREARHPTADGLISTPMAITRDFTHFVMIIKSLIHIFDLDATNESNAIKPKPSLNPTIDKLSAADNAFPVLPLKLDQFAFFPTDGELLFVGLPFVRGRYVTGTHTLP